MEVRSDCLVFGANGYVGSNLCASLSASGQSYMAATSRLENPADVTAELDAKHPRIVFHCAGLTGRPNIDWCEEHKLDVVRVNVTGTLALAEACFVRNIYLVYMGTGCIYEYDNASGHGMDGAPFTEDDAPNYRGSFYSLTKGYVDTALAVYPNVLILRLRMPASSQWHPRNIIVKLAGYNRLINVPNSMSMLDDLMPVAVDMAAKHITGVFNFTNPGTISHNEIMQLYCQHIDSSHHFENITETEQEKMLRAGRCNCHLDVNKLLALYPEIPSVKESMTTIFGRLAATK